MPASEHVVQFYDTDACLFDAVAAYCGDALQTGDVALVIATAEHRVGVAERLQARGLIDAAGNHHRYLALDAAESLSCLLVDGEVDAARFAATVGGIISRAAEPGRPVRIFGEMVALLVAAGKSSAAIHLEKLWNDLQAQGLEEPTRAFSLFCAYPMHGFGGEANGKLFRDVCAAHAHVLPTESYLALANESDRLRAIAELQQQARSLPIEVAARQRTEARLEEALAAEHSARQTSEDALQLQDDFLSIAAHELRNPLAALSLHAQVALRRLECDEYRDAARTQHSLHLQAISGEVARLSRLLDRLLDASCLNAGQLALHRRQTDLTLLSEQAVAAAEARSGRCITLQAPALLPAHVDPMRLHAVLANLLDNAIKYSPGGEPIAVTLSQRTPGTVELIVADRGTGIPPEVRDKIFERFFQARPDDASQGLGLGLYVSRQIVELHGGQIRANFPPDGGTRIVVSLPVGMEMSVDLQSTG